MGLRKFIAIVVGIIAFVGTGSLIAIGVQNIWPGYAFSDHPFERLSLLFISFLVASSVYNMIKGDEPEPEAKENQGLTSKEISKKLEEMRSPEKHVTMDKPHTEIPESKVETVESNNYRPLNENKSKVAELNEVKKETLKPISNPGKNHNETAGDTPQNIDLNQNFCPDCGGSNVAHAKYCAFCGSKLKD